MKNKKWDKYLHGHLYYVVGLLSLTLFFMTIVQAIYTHIVEKNFMLAAMYYLIASVFLAVVKRAYSRGRGHYKY